MVNRPSESNDCLELLINNNIEKVQEEVEERVSSLLMGNDEESDNYESMKQ